MAVSLSAGFGLIEVSVNKRPDRTVTGGGWRLQYVGLCEQRR